MLPDKAKTVLVTSVDTALGLQIATYLSTRGWRVLCGCRAGGLGARLAASWAAAAGARLAPIELDVAREDSLEEAARAVAQHLPAGENGVWAVVNTAGTCGARGAVDWERTLRTNVLGALRVARAFTPLLTATNGRLFYLGLTSDTELESESASGGNASEAAVCFAASRWAVCGAARALRAAAALRRVHVVALHAPQHEGRELYAPPVLVRPAAVPGNSRPETPTSETGSASSETCSVNMPGEAAEYSARVLSPPALKTLEDALLAPVPKASYQLKQKPESWLTRVPSFRMVSSN